MAASAPRRNGPRLKSNQARIWTPKNDLSIHLALDQSCGHCVNRNSSSWLGKAAKGVPKYTHKKLGYTLAPYFPHARKAQKGKKPKKKICTGKWENRKIAWGAVKQENENCSQMFIPLVNLKNFEHLALPANKSLLFFPFRFHFVVFFFWLVVENEESFTFDQQVGTSCKPCGQPKSAKLANPTQQLSSNFQL